MDGRGWHDRRRITKQARKMNFIKVVSEIIKYWPIILKIIDELIKLIEQINDNTSIISHTKDLQIQQLIERIKNEKEKVQKK